MVILYRIIPADYPTAVTFSEHYPAKFQLTSVIRMFVNDEKYHFVVGHLRSKKKKETR